MLTTLAKYMIFNYLSYKAFIADHIEKMPKNGRGQFKKLAEYLGISTVVVSQIFKANRELSPENAFRTAKFFGLNSLETKYFLKLVEYEKASHHELKTYLLEEINKLQVKSKKIKSSYQNSKVLSDEDKLEFYSDRYYSSIRMASSIDGVDNVKDFAEFFNIPESKTQKIINFLIRTELCKYENGRITMGPQHTFVAADSPFIRNHHRNWRIYSISKMDNFNQDEELMYTAPMSLSKKDFVILRNNLLKVIDETLKIVGPSKEETVGCLNIDFLKLT